MSLSGQGEPKRPLFCCFFYKLDSIKYRRCGNHELRSWAYMLQHFQRQHLLKKGIYCARCRQVWDSSENSEALRHEHIKQDTCQKKTPIETGWLLLEEYDGLKKARGRNDSDRWYWGFLRLFPGIERPPSPFFEPMDVIIRRNAESTLSISRLNDLQAIMELLPPGEDRTSWLRTQILALTNPQRMEQASSNDASIAPYALQTLMVATKTTSEAFDADSGFFSRSTGSIGPTTQPSEPAQDAKPDRPQFMNFYNYRESQSRYPSNQPDDDVQSVRSMDDSIASSIESTTTSSQHQEAAVDYIARKFIDDPELLSLYQESVRHLDKAKFVRNHMRLLKGFYLELLPKCSSPSQNLAVRFLRTRSRRTLVSSEIWRLVSDGDSPKEIHQLFDKEQDSRFALERFLRNEDAAEIGMKVNETIDEVSDDSGNDELSDAGDDDAFAKLEETGQFLTGGLPFKLFKQSVSEFLHPKTKEQGPQTVPGHELLGSTAERGLFSRLVSWAKRISRPKLKAGFRRIEWTCDCGSDLYADFPECEGDELDKLEASLQSPGADTVQTAGVRLDCPSTSGCVASGSKSEQHGCSMPANSPGKAGSCTAADPSSHTELAPANGQRPKFLALCVNTGGIYKTLAEIDTTGYHCDSCAFLVMKNEYLRIRCQRSRFWLLIKPTTVEFIQFTLWNLRQGYISVCNRPDSPESIPPDHLSEYEYAPKPLATLPPVPREIFIHFLNHNENDPHSGKRIWIPRLPRRLSKRVIDAGEGCSGWGIHVIEGPNRKVISLIMMVTILGSIIAAVTWSIVRHDVPGGATLGAFIVALPVTHLATLLFLLATD